MVVNGRELPASFVEFLNEHCNTMWELNEESDSYGNPLQTDFAPSDTVERMEEDTALLAEFFGPPDQYGGEGITPEVLRMVREGMAKDPTFLFDITDFSKLVQFGSSAGGAPFCFDFRDDLKEPSVILHDDSHGRWRRLAPNFATFISLWKHYQRGG